ncbi:T9SS type A sorting domain-containing protein [Hymenobacter sp. HMF4947]|uniref:T9SS type A sorting domain-containing protein n=1 Tax=Hymenobacter ginkgonis TaxID=2682976 RepID=A0A7K1T940_9BACT|nr:T9SS type A sorting domain-containing protein [Hymenobacter ginkgonis]MVN74915.1 T9SS type A sorting domain-containing protein [Hymenobacter ginkgonis]
MRQLLRLLGLPAVLLGFAAQAQTTPVLLPTQPLSADLGRTTTAPVPAITSAQQRTAALGLPFFDDFTTPLDGQPSPLRWQAAATDYPDGVGLTQHYGGGGAYVSNRLAIEPLTRGTVTLDGLRANGLPYNSSSASFYSKTDTLTSLPLDLSAFSAGSRVYLSYAWQAGSLAGSPVSNSSSTPVSLTLEFLDNAGRWNTIWTYLGANKSTKFRQQIFAINQAAYFHSSFRFRFRASGNQSSARDAFGLDYIYVNNNRADNDTIFQDVAISRGLSSPLRRYTAMPVWQYNAATTSELNPAVTATVNNLTATGNPIPIAWQGTVRELTTGGFGPATWVTGNRPELANARQDVITGDASTAPLSLSTQARRFRYTLALQTRETNPLTLANDTVSRDLELSNYYAYDDGTAEQSFGIPAVSTGPTSYLAVAFAATKADQVSAVRLLPVFNNIPTSQGGENFLNRSVTVAVWADANGQPGPTPLATSTFTLDQKLVSQGFYEVRFATPVAVSGRFYVGYGQPANGQFLLYGLDLNNQTPASSLFYTQQGTWTPFQPATGGALLLRPVMNNSVLATQAQQAVSAQFSLYPNPTPSNTTVAVSGPTFSRAALLDVLGRQVWQQAAAEAGQPTLRLPAGLPGGVYMVQLTLPDGSSATRRLVVE